MNSVGNGEKGEIFKIVSFAREKPERNSSHVHLFLLGKAGIICFNQILLLVE